MQSIPQIACGYRLSHGRFRSHDAGFFFGAATSQESSTQRDLDTP